MEKCRFTFNCAGADGVIDELTSYPSPAFLCVGFET